MGSVNDQANDVCHESVLCCVIYVLRSMNEASQRPNFPHDHHWTCFFPIIVKQWISSTSILTCTQPAYCIPRTTVLHIILAHYIWEKEKSITLPLTSLAISTACIYLFNCIPATLFPSSNANGFTLITSKMFFYEFIVLWKIIQIRRLD